MKAVILAAGRGERLHPLTVNRPKHLLPVAGRPLLEHLLRNVADAGIRDVLVVTHHMEDQIRGSFADGSELGLRIGYARQEETRGTADAFRCAAGFVVGEDWLGVYGDLWVAPGVLRGVVSAHRRGSLTVTGLERDPYLYGAWRLEGDRVLGVVEKPEPGSAPSSVTNAGIYVFPPAALREMEGTPLSSRGEYEVTDTVNRLIAAGTEARLAMLGGDEWVDVGHPWNLLEANELEMKNLEGRVLGRVEAGATLRGPVCVAESAVVKAGSYVEGPVYIGEGSEVGPNCYLRPGTVLTRGNKVGAGCEVKNSILLPGATVPHLSYVGDSVLGEKVNLGAGTITANLRFDNRSVRMTIKDRRVDTGRRKMGAVIGDNVQTGVNVSILPGVRIGNGAWVAPGVTVTRDVPDGVYLGPDGIRERSL